MTWSVLNFGKYKGKTLPQVIFADPDWFFNAIDDDYFSKRGFLAKEAEDLYQKSRNIRIPQKVNKEKLVAEYATHPQTGTFVNMELVPASRPRHDGATSTSRKDVIDLRVPRTIAHYDKLGCKLLIQSVKYYLFGKQNVRMTKEKCEDFFENSANFALPTSS